MENKQQCGIPASNHVKTYIKDKNNQTLQSGWVKQQKQNKTEQKNNYILYVKDTLSIKLQIRGSKKISHLNANEMNVEVTILKSDKISSNTKNSTRNRKPLCNDMSQHTRKIQ